MRAPAACPTLEDGSSPHRERRHRAPPPTGLASSQSGSKRRPRSGWPMPSPHPPRSPHIPACEITFPRPAQSWWHFVACVQRGNARGDSITTVMPCQTVSTGLEGGFRRLRNAVVLLVARSYVRRRAILQYDPYGMSKIVQASLRFTDGPCHGVRASLWTLTPSPGLFRPGNLCRITEENGSHDRVEKRTASVVGSGSDATSALTPRKT